jgi:hypothetical protein
MRNHFSFENFSTSPTWASVRAFVHEFFVFWPDGEDRLWAKATWPALEAAGLYSAAGEDGLQWTRANVMALSLLYAESAVRLGFDIRGRYLDRNWIIITFGSINNCELRLISVREAISSLFGYPEKTIRPMLSSMVRGSDTCWKGESLKAYLDRACARLPDRTSFREDRLFDFWNGGLVDPLYFECIP